MVGKPCTRLEEKQQRVEDVRRLYRSKQALPKGSFRATTYRSSNRLDSRMRPVILHRMLLRISSDHPKRGRPNQDGLHHPLRGIRQQDHVIRPEVRPNVELLSHNQTWRVTMALNRVVITCRLPLQSMGGATINR